VTDGSTTASDRRLANGGDRRKNSRAGRRAGESNGSRRWRRVAWVFAAYALCVSVRSVPSAIRKAFSRKTTTT